MDIAQSLALVGGGIDTANKVVGFFKTLRGAGGDPEAVAAAKEQVLEVKEALYTAKDTIFALKDQVAEMVERIKELEVRLAQRDDYCLTQIGPGAFAYVRKDAGEAVKSGPWLCQTCFDDGKQAVFQVSKLNLGRDDYKCPRCQAVIQVPHDRKMEVRTVPRRDPFRTW